MLFWLLACHVTDPVSDGATTPSDTDTDTPTTPVAGDPRCPVLTPDEWDAAGVLTQDWSAGTGTDSLEAYAGLGWTGASGTFHDIWATPGWEAVRFELDVPSCVYGVEVQYGKLPHNPKDVTFGLYRDFGTNGMDFHPDQPWWEGVLELSGDNELQWLTYEAPPLYLDGPSLVYGASYRDGTKGPALLMDGDYKGDGYCSLWDDCHSALNYPEADSQFYENGTTFPWQYDFLVRLQCSFRVVVVDPSETWFHVDPTVRASANVAWGDFDDDGDDDLMTNGPTLYRNDAGVLTDVTPASGVAAAGVYTGGGVWGDYDNDGCLDYFGMGPGSTAGELLLHNSCDGTFTDATAASTISDFQSDWSCLGSGDPEYSPTAGATWTDFDNDGLLDLVQANFLCFDTYTNYPDRFWHNLGGGMFEQWSTDHGFVLDDKAGRGAETVDVDGDGDLDLGIVDYVLQANLFYENLGGGQFDEIGRDNGFAGISSLEGATLYFGHSIGAKWGDLDGDLDLDVVVANLAHPRFYDFSSKTELLLNDGAGALTDVAADRGIVYQETHSNPSLLDLDNDGDLDLLITEVYDGRPVDVYTNDGGAVFTPARLYAGITTENGWGSAVADYDRDGDEDYVAYDVYRNDAATGHWLALRLVGDVASNRSAIGAIAWVTSGGVTRMRTVSGGNGTGCQDSQTLHFGLGTATSVDEVTVWYPGGATVTYEGLTVDAAWRVTESGSHSPL